MADRSPGEPLNPEQVTSAQGIPVGGFLLSSHSMQVGGGHYAMNVPTIVPMPLEKGTHHTTDIPFVPLSTERKP